MDTSEGFGALLHQAQRLTASMDPPGGGGGADALPRVERNLAQIRDAAAKLAYRGPYSTAGGGAGGIDSTDVKASLLLGSRGYDVQRASQKLEGLSSMKSFEPLEPVHVTDIQGFLKNERENALLAAVEKSRTTTLSEMKARHWEALECEWEREKQKILTDLVDSTADSLDFLHDHQSIAPVSLQGRSGMDSTEMAYSKQVYVYNECVVQGGVRPDLVDLFVGVASRFDNANVCELWTVVQHMVDVPVVLADDPVARRVAPATQAAFMRQALLYLERSYVKYIERVIYGNMAQAQLGGVPGTLNIVRSFLNVRPSLKNSEIVESGCFNGHPIWAVIYYCLRCGDVQAAMTVVLQSRQVLGDFTKYFEEYASSDNKRLSASLEAEIKLQYRRSIHSSADPFKRAVYCVVGRCDPREDHTEAALSTDDYLWIKLSQAVVDDDDARKPDRLTLAQLQSLLLDDFGETHFSAYQQPYLYFRVLFLTAQFEAAVEFMSRVESLWVHALHVALVLHEAGLLLNAAHIHAPLLSASKESGDPAQVRRLNFVRFIMMYTRKFETTDPRDALEYFYFLRDIQMPHGADVFHSCISELVLESREFDALLGCLQADETRRPGAVDKFRQDMRKLTAYIASEAERRGQLEDAVKLYDLAGNAERVVDLLNKLLSQVLSQPPADQSNKDRLKNIAIAIATRYKTLSIEGSRSAMITFHLQLDLMTFFDLYHSRQYEQGYNLIQDLKLLPFSTDVVERKVSAFRDYTDEIRRNIPDILLATMTILLTKYRDIKGVGGGGTQSPLVTRPVVCRSDTPKPMIDATFLRAQAQALIMFAGMIPYRMPGDTNSRLVHMEVLMN